MLLSRRHWMQGFKVNTTLRMQEFCILGFCLSHLDVGDVHTGVRLG